MLLTPHQKRQGSADFARNACIALEAAGLMCNRSDTRVAPQSLATRGYNFYTPSPDGQVPYPLTHLPVFLCSTSNTWRLSADPDVVCENLWISCSNLSSVRENVRIDTGADQCQSNHGSSAHSCAQHLQGAAKPAPIRRLSVARQEPASRFSRMAACLRARPLAQQGISYSAKPTQANATDAAASRFVISAPRAPQRCRNVVNFPQWASKAQSRGKFYETSNLHFRSVSRCSDWRMHQATGIQPWRYFAVGSAHSRVIDQRDNAVLPSLNDMPVPYHRGGQMRLTTLKTGDSTCSKRS